MVLFLSALLYLIQVSPFLLKNHSLFVVYISKTKDNVMKAKPWPIHISTNYFVLHWFTSVIARVCPSLVARDPLIKNLLHLIYVL